MKKNFLLFFHPRSLVDWLTQKEAAKKNESGRALNDRCYDGNCPFFNYRIIDSSQDGPSLKYQEIVDTLISFSQNIESQSQ